MPTTVIAMYDNADKARQVVQEMVQAGFNKNAIELLNGGRLGYANELRRGAALVTLEAENETAEDALDIMERCGPRDLLTAELGSERRRPAGGTVAEGEESARQNTTRSTSSKLTPA